MAEKGWANSLRDDEKARFRESKDAAERQRDKLIEGIRDHITCAPGTMLGGHAGEWFSAYDLRSRFNHLLTEIQDEQNIEPPPSATPFGA